MMTIRVKTGQKDLYVCIKALLFAYDTGVIEMRTPWFSISKTEGLKWKSIAFGTEVLGQVAADQANPLKWAPNEHTYPDGFLSYAGIHHA